MDTEQIKGYFTYTVYSSDTYMVSSFSSEEGNITVTGPFFDYVRNKKYLLTGMYCDHPKYGFQFNYMKVEDVLPDVKEDIINYLAVTFDGIGKKTAEKIVEHFGNDIFTILKEDPERIHEVKLSNRQYESVIDGFLNMNDPKSEAVYKLISGGFTNSESLRIYDYFKDKIDIVIKNNPYLIYLKVYGIPFSHVCDFAAKLEFEDKLLKLKEAFLVYAFKEITFNLGDTYLLREDFESSYRKNFNDDDLDRIIDLCVNERYLYVLNEKYYLYEEYRNEIIINEYLKTQNESINLEDDVIKDAIDSVGRQLDVAYDDYQIDAIRNFFLNDISIITGGPGTGKTTVVKSLVAIFGEYLPYNSIVVVAPTGRAAKRINEVCHVDSKTIHSLLRWNKETNTFVFDEENPLMYDAIIIDEFSMVDNFLFASLIKAASGVKKICIIGDDNQLPSIRQGNLLSDLISSKLFTLTRLKYNHRQHEGSEIIDLSYSIINEDVYLDRYTKDIIHYNLDEIDSIVSIIDDCIDEGYSLDDIQVLAPMYKGIYGINNLNALLQDHFNPKSRDKKERNANGMLFREGDKILQLKNRPTDDVYNGDIGILEEINNEDKYFMIDYQGTTVFYKFDDLQDISLAYAMSVHKAQGSEYKVCLFVLPNYSKNMLNRKLIYTAISRAKNRLYILGDKESFYAGVNYESRQRKTTLYNLLIEK